MNNIFILARFVPHKFQKRAFFAPYKGNSSAKTFVSAVWICAPWAKRTRVSLLRPYPYQGVTGSYFIAYSTGFLLIVVFSLYQLDNKFTHGSDIAGTLILSTHYLGVKEKVGCLISVDHWQWQMHHSRNRKSLLCQHWWWCSDWLRI